jgi:hypothetical protein
MELPDSLISRATPSGQEHGWSIAEFPTVLADAADLGFACIGGQFQFLLPDGTCEAYWLNADSTPQLPDEPWHEYVSRAAREVRDAFDQICAETDFIREAQQWQFLRDKLANPDFDVLQHLIFVAYFNNEPGSA